MRIQALEHDEVWNEVASRLVAMSSTGLAAGEIAPGTTLRDELGLSSMQAVMLALDLEERFDIAVEDEEIEHLATVGDIVRLVEQKRGTAR